MSQAIATYSTERAGWRELVIENDLLRVTSLPGYGGWILSAFFKPRGVEILCQAPRGVIHKDDSPVVTDPLYLYRARSPGGWPEIFPHGSAPTQVGEVTMPFHGEAVNRAWNCEVLESGGEEAIARLTLECHLMPLRIERVMRMSADRAALVLEETATNYSGEPVDFMWGHHPIFGPPLMAGGTKIFAPAARSLTTDREPAGWPEHDGQDLSLCPPEGAGTSEMFYLDQLKAGWAAIVNRELKLGAALAWDLETFPFAWIWRECGGATGYPAHGRTYGVAIEPFSSLPGARERGERLLHLAGGESLATRLVFSAFEGLTDVTGVSPQGEVAGA